MKLNEACKDILMQLDTVIKDINEDDFVKPIPSLNKSTIGQHIRHTLEFFMCLMNNISTGEINYDKRDHDKVIETDRFIASAMVKQLIVFLNEVKEDVSLNLDASYSLQDDDSTVIKTNLFRELAYNIEHAIHHMAIIKIGIKEIAPYVKLPSHFGIAVSTIKYQQRLPITK